MTTVFRQQTKQHRSEAPVGFQIVVHPIDGPKEGLDVTCAVIAAVAGEIEKLHHGNDVLNWLEAETLIHSIWRNGNASKVGTPAVSPATLELKTLKLQHTTNEGDSNNDTRTLDKTIPPSRQLRQWVPARNIPFRHGSAVRSLAG